MDFDLELLCFVLDDDFEQLVVVVFVFELERPRPRRFVVCSSLFGFWFTSLCFSLLCLSILTIRRRLSSSSLFFVVAVLIVISVRFSLLLSYFVELVLLLVLFVPEFDFELLFECIQTLLNL